MLINFTTFSVFNNTIISNNTTLLSSLNVSGITTLNNATTCLSSLNVSDYTTIRPIVGDRGSYNHALAPLTITNQTPTGTTLNDSLPVLNLCRQGVGNVAYGARATLCLSRFEDPGNVWSRTRLDFKLASDTYNDVITSGTLANFDIEGRTFDIGISRYCSFNLRYRRSENDLRYRVRYDSSISKF
jgi:hypothetical protein